MQIRENEECISIFNLLSWASDWKLSFRVRGIWISFAFQFFVSALSSGPCERESGLAACVRVFINALEMLGLNSKWAYDAYEQKSGHIITIKI